MTGLRLPRSTISLLPRPRRTFNPFGPLVTPLLRQRNFSTSMASKMNSAPAPAASPEYSNGTDSKSKSNSKGSEEKPKLPPLTAKEFAAYNRMAVHMDMFHNNFRLTWRTLQTACERPKTLSPRQLITTGLHFISALDLHHTIEEQHIFPVLAARMPEFRAEVSLLSQHKLIHKGLDALQAYLEACKRGEVDLERGEVKRLLDAFGEVLFTHLDEEVKTLGAENMRRYWSLAEMGRMRM